MMTTAKAAWAGDYYDAFLTVNDVAKRLNAEVRAAVKSGHLPPARYRVTGIGTLRAVTFRTDRHDDAATCRKLRAMARRWNCRRRRPCVYHDRIISAYSERFVVVIVPYRTTAAAVYNRLRAADAADTRGATPRDATIRGAAV